MSNNLKFKIILLFIAINLVFIVTMSFYIYNDNEYDQKINNRHNHDELIETTMVKSTLLLIDYHKKILAGEYIDPQTYLGIVRELSFFVSNSMLFSVESYIYKDKQFLLTATSATDEEFRAKRYLSYGHINQKDKALLNRVYALPSFHEEYANNQVAMTFEVDGLKYIILATIDKSNPIKQFNHLLTFGLVALILLALLVLLMRYTLIPLIKEIKTIDRVLNRLFNYILSPQDKSSVEYVQGVKHHELIGMSQNINTNIKAILDRMDRDANDRAKDALAIDKMIEALTPTHHGVFLQNVQIEAHNKKLNQLKDIINQLMKRMDGLINQMDTTTTSYLHHNYNATINVNEYQDTMDHLINNINALGDQQSTYFLDQIAYLVDMNNNVKIIDGYIYNNSYMLDDLLTDMRDIVTSIEGDYKFAFEFDNIIQVVKQENIYLGDLLKRFSQKYLESIRLINDFRDGVFDNNANELLSRFNAVVKDSSVRDQKAQEELIAKIRDLISTNLEEVNQENVEELMRLLIEELVKDIEYSLYLMDQEVDKLAHESSKRLSSYTLLKDKASGMRESILSHIKDTHLVEKAVKKMSNQTNDVKYGIIDENHFKDSDRANELLTHKGEPHV